MNWLHRAIIGASLLASVPAAYAQAPPPVPGLPDTERRTSYSITASTCACAVGFALYGDSTDYQNWVEVFINGVRVNFNDATFGWTITSPTGPLATIPRPITDAVLTFNAAQTGTVQIVGSRRQRRTSQFNENRGVAARDLNQVLTDIISVQREYWDKINDMTGRGLFSQPGNTIGLMPLPTACANKLLGFDGTGLNPICTTSSGGGGSTNPGGLSGQLQWNNANVFGGIAGATSNGTTVTFLNNDLLLGGTGTGTTTFASANTGASNFTVTFPAQTSNLAFTAGAFANGQCLQASGTAGGIVTTGSACAASSTPGGTTTQLQYNNAGALGGISGATSNGTTVTFANSDLILAGSSTGVTTFTSANAGASNFTVTVPAATANLLFNVGAFVSGQCLQTSGTAGGVATTGAACGGAGSVPGGSSGQVQYNNAANFGGISGVTSNGTTMTFASSDLILGGSSTGTTTFASANASASNFTITFPAATGTVALTSGANVASVTNSDGTLTISPTTGAVVASLALGHANTWTAAQTFTNSDILLLGSSTGATTFSSSNATASNFTVTFPSATANLAYQVGAFVTGHCVQTSGTVGGLVDSGSACGSAGVSSISNSDGTLTISPTTGAAVASLALGHANTWTAAQTFNNSDILLLGSSTGATTFTSANASASNFTVTFPAATTNLAFTVGAITTGHCLQASGTVGGVADSGTTCGGTGTPGGVSGNVQFNNAGAFGGSANLTFGASLLTVGQASVATGGLRLFNSATANATTIQAGAATAGAVYTWPLAIGAAGSVLTDAAGNGTLSWAPAGGGVSSVTNSDGTLTISPTTGAVIASLNTAHANTWTAIQTYNNSDIVLLGTSTGGITFTSNNVTASNFTLTFPAVNDQLVGRATIDGLTNKTLASTTDTIGIVSMVLGSDATGDIWYRNSSGNLTRLGIGGNGTCLSVVTSLPAWGSCSGSNAVIVGTTTVSGGVAGNMLYTDGALLQATGGVTWTGTGQMGFALGTITTNIKAINITATWNAGGTVFDAPLLMNVTNTASNVASNLMDLQVGGNTVLSAGPSSGVQLGNAVSLGWDGAVGVNNVAFIHDNTGSTNNTIGIIDPNSLTSATALHVYNTTDSLSGVAPTNYERAILDWTVNLNTFTIGTQQGGTGTTRGMHFQLGNQTLTFGSTVAFGALSSGAASFIISTSGGYNFAPVANWSAGQPQTSDGGISRIAAAVMAFGNGTNGSQSGWLQWGGEQRTATATNYTNNTPTTILSAALAAGRTYSFEIYVPVTAGGTPGGLQIGLIASGGLTVTNMVADCVLHSNNVIVGQAQATSLTTLCNAVMGAATGYGEVHGTITVNAAGTFNVQTAQSSTNATTMTVGRGARLIMNDMP